MIKNDKQFKYSQEVIVNLKKTLASPIKEGVPESVAKAAKGYIQEIIDEIQKEIDDYLEKRKGKKKPARS